MSCYRITQRRPSFYPPSFPFLLTFGKRVAKVLEHTFLTDHPWWRQIFSTPLDAWKFSSGFADPEVASLRLHENSLDSRGATAWHFPLWNLKLRQGLTYVSRFIGHKWRSVLILTQTGPNYFEIQITRTNLCPTLRNGITTVKLQNCESRFVALQTSCYSSFSTWKIITKRHFFEGFGDFFSLCSSVY